MAAQTRQPSATVLHQALRSGVPAFFTAAADAGRDIPGFIEKELRGFLRCGDMEYGFAKVYCRSCGYSYRIGFSCKGRGFCPSCTGRRMADVSCHLVDRVLPNDVPYRQWVLSFPPPLRYLLAYDSKALGAALKYFIAAIVRWQRNEAKRRYGLRRVADGLTGAVTVVQRFGSALNLNIHFHSIIADGVWEVRPSGEHVFRKLGQPQDDDRDLIGWRACQGLLRYLRKTGQWCEVDDGDGHLDTSDDTVEPLLAEVYGASIRGRLVFGEGRGSRVMLLRCGANRPPTQHEKSRPKGYSFDVHAGVSVRAGDRAGLTRLCRYLCRPPAGNERFSKREDGRIVVRLKTAWRDGTSHVVLTPLELTEKLVALIPPPRVNMIRYHGVFAPNAADRAALVPQPPEEATQDTADPRCTYAGRQSYALLMKRVFAIDVEVCRNCGARNTTIDFFTTRDAIEKELRNRGPPIQVDLPGIAA